jgi:hypothetical protein
MINKRDRFRFLWPLFVSNRYFITFLCYFIALSWMSLHPLVNISSFEAKPRGTFISENAIAVGTPPKLFKEFDTFFALELNTEFTRFTMDLHKDGNGNTSDYNIVALWFKHKLIELGFETEIQKSRVRKRRFQKSFHVDNLFNNMTRNDGETIDKRHVIVSVLRAISGSSGKDALLITSTLPSACSDDNINMNAACSCGMMNQRQHKTPSGCLPHGSFILIALLERLKEAKWRGTDILLVLSQPEIEGSINGHFPVYNPGVEAFLRSYYYDEIEEQRLFEKQQAWDSMNFITFLQLSFLQPFDAITVKELHDSANKRLSFGLSIQSSIFPSQIHSGPIRAAFALDIEGSVTISPRFASILTQGNGGRLPEMDLYDLTETCLQTSDGLEQIQFLTVPLEFTINDKDNDFKDDVKVKPRIVQKSKIEIVSLDTIISGLNEYVGFEYVERLKTLLLFSKAILLSPIHGILGSLQSKRMQAIAVKFYESESGRSIKDDKGKDKKANQRSRLYEESSKMLSISTGVGRALEQWLRALTPLDERLHASSQFYLLMEKDKFLGLNE